MNIKLINIDDISFENDISEMSKEYNITNKEYYLIDWIPNDINTITFCKSLDENVPIIVFDRYCSISNDDFIWLDNRNSVLMEPAINHKNGFIFQPYWIDFNKITFNHKERPYIIGYKHKSYVNDDIFDLLIKSSNDGYSTCIDAYIRNDVFKGIKNKIDIKPSRYNDFCYLLISGSDDDIQRGVVPDIRDMVYNGTVPLLWHTHYTMHGLFKHLIIERYSDLKYFCNIYDTIKNLYLHDIMDNIRMYMPEMIQENFIHTVLNIFEKM